MHENIILRCIISISGFNSQCTTFFYVPKKYQWQTSVIPFNAWPKMVLLMLAITCSVRLHDCCPLAICKTEVIYIYKYLSEICHHRIELVWKDTKTAQQWQLVKLLVLWGSKMTYLKCPSPCSVRPLISNFNISLKCSCVWFSPYSDIQNDVLSLHPYIIIVKM